MKKTVSFSKDATNIFFHILTRCNLQCRHCYINPAQHGKNTLPLSVIEAWLSQFVGEHHTANVIFLGGEPTLHPDLGHAIRLAKDMGYHSVTVDTNGYLFHDILSEVEPEAVDFFSFSLDGATRETNDRIRGKGCYDACISGIRKAVGKGFHTSLIYTVSQENLHELAQMPERLRSLGIQRFFIQVIGIRGKSVREHGERSAASLQVSKKEWLSVVPEVAEATARLGITTVYPKVFLERGEVFECAGLVANNYFIFPNGRVYRCPLCEDYPLHSMKFEGDHLVKTEKLNEADLFRLNIPEGCVMNKLIQPENLSYTHDNTPQYQIACCMLKEMITIAD